MNNTQDQGSPLPLCSLLMLMGHGELARAEIGSTRGR